MKIRYLMLFIICLLNLGSVLAAHYVVGYVNDSVDGVTANGRTIVVWNPVYGISENLTDIVGSTGNSGTDNNYMIDCEMLPHSCIVGNQISAQVESQTDGYFSVSVNVTITGAGFDVLPNMTLYPPFNITSVSANVSSYSCGILTTARVTCNLTGDIKNITIESFGPEGPKNYSAQEIIYGSYYSDIPLNQTGQWFFKCLATDQAGNSDSVNSSYINVYHSGPDLTLSSSDISFSNTNPIENQSIDLKANIHNNGCQDANSFPVAFYYGNPSAGGSQIGGSVTASIPQRSNLTVNRSWIAQIGPANFFVIADVNNSIAEGNESNNQANNSIQVNAWEVFYGNISASQLISDSSSNNMTLWFNASKSDGSIFVSDPGGVIHWASLLALGKNTDNGPTSGDFSGIDSLFNMSGYNDSISNLFTTDGNSPRDVKNFSVQSRIILDVPVIYSTNSSNFTAGILWDSFYDTGNGHFDISDNEKIVFVTNINPRAGGAYGNYDYEIKIPARLRNQYSQVNTQIDFYYELK